MAGKSNDSSGSVKPSKPRADFPLFPHASGRWAKKIRGTFKYFGKVSDDPKGVLALEKWLDEKEDLLSGRTPRVSGGGLSLGDLCNRFLTVKKSLIVSGELSPRTFAQYKGTTDKLVAFFGRRRLVLDLAADDFEQLRAEIAKDVGPFTVRNDVRMARMVFKYAYDAGLIDRPVRFGTLFKIPPKRLLRQARQQAGKRMFDADELRSIIAAAGQPIRAMVLLAINTGCGNTDVANLTESALHLESGWLDYPRPKTSVERRVPLWPETVEALREAIAKRPACDNPTGLVFLTKYRQPWVRVSETGGVIDGVACEFGKLIKRPRCPQCGVIAPAKRDEIPEQCGACQWKPTDDDGWHTLYRSGLNFYAVRHSFQTIAEESKDLPAVKAAMGHVDGTMSGEYREEISDQRMRSMVEAVRRWLWPDAVPSPEPAGAPVKKTPRKLVVKPR